MFKLIKQKFCRSIVFSICYLSSVGQFTINSAFSSETLNLDRAPIERIHNVASLQKGAKTFINYCLSCHSAINVRYNSLRSIGLDEEQIKDNLLFTGEKIGELMQIAMTPADAKKWFGVTPPDLSVIARSHGADWLYTFLRSYKRDHTTISGWNNTVYPDVAMPHALWELQATLKSSEYDEVVADLTAFLSWMGEPNQSTRKRLGVWVLLFIGVFFLLVWRLNAAYWRDIKH